MTHTHDMVEICQAMVDFLKAVQGQYGIEEVYYGDERLIPSYPAICVDPGPMTRTFTQTGFKTDNRITLYIIIYHGPVQTAQMNRKECDKLAVQLMDEIHTDLTLGGRVMNGLCAELEPGASITETQEFVKAHRITWVALSKTGVA
jgi:hypothetical protein